MSIADDQIRNDSYNALDVLGKRINKDKDPMKAAQAVVDFEADLEKAKEEKTIIEPGKTIVNPEELLKEIQGDMSR